MKTIITLSLIFSFSAFADFSEEHTPLCAAKAKCNLVIAPIDVVEVSRTCQGNLADITCKVMMLKTSDSASMNLICGEAESPILTQVLEAKVLSYNVSAITGSVVINDPYEYHLFSNPVIDVLVAKGEKVKAKMVLTLQERPIALTNVTCE